MIYINPNWHEAGLELVSSVESLWGDCMFIPAFGVIVVDLCYFALFEDFSL